MDKILFPTKNDQKLEISTKFLYAIRTIGDSFDKLFEKIFFLFNVIHVLLSVSDFFVHF